LADRLGEVGIRINLRIFSYSLIRIVKRLSDEDEWMKGQGSRRISSLTVKLLSNNDTSIAEFSVSTQKIVVIYL
jgi:hypothetical protein